MLVVSHGMKQVLPDYVGGLAYVVGSKVHRAGARAKIAELVTLAGTDSALCSETWEGGPFDGPF